MNMAPGPGAARAALRATWLSLAVALPALGASSRAGWLAVERSPDTLECPDARTLRAATEQLLHSAPASDAGFVRVKFERLGEGLVARLERGGAAAGARRLEEAGGDCEPLSQAVVTALALLLETHAEFAEPVAQVPERAPRRTPPPYALGLGARAGAASGVIDAIAPFFGAELSLRKQRVQASLGALWVPRQSTALGPGHVSVELRALTTRVCLGLLDLGEAELWSCTGLFGGTLQARATGYTEDFAEVRPWLALPFELSVRKSLGGTHTALGMRAGATLVLPTRRETFSVAGLGPAVEPARAAALLWLGFDGWLLW